MNSALYIGATGMKGLSEGMQVTSNNLANVSTIGFKHQDILFSDLIYAAQGDLGSGWESQEESKVALGQAGKGLQVDSIRTIFSQGAFESSNSVTDLAINGKGFFQVCDEQNGDVYYTRAGDFIQNEDGVLRTPSGLALNGYQVNADGSRSSSLSPVVINEFSVMPAKASSAVELSLNLEPKQDNSVDAANPYFSLLGQYDASSSTPLGDDAYNSSQRMTLYDASGNAHTITAYFDGVPSPAGEDLVEFLIAGESSPQYDAAGNLLPVAAGDGLLMSGVLHFDSSGRLTNISAFTPGVEGSKDLADWQAASLDSTGTPQIDFHGAPVSLNFGISGDSGWQNAPLSAADVGTDASKLGELGGTLVRATQATTTNGGSTLGHYSQDGYAEGILSTYYIEQDGTVCGYFSNGQEQDLWQIPVCCFVSEDGLRREGGNLFSATAEAGLMGVGVAGTDNYGSINSFNIETSNVDLSAEMVNMIITQRGFQSNSKVVTTADQMLQKAMELKRN